MWRRRLTQLQNRYNFTLEVYHSFVAETMRNGFHWARYKREGDAISIFNLTCPHICRGVVNREIADKYERWFKWMVKQNDHS